MIHSCKLCKLRFKTLEELSGHQQKLHGKQFEFQCGICSMGFNTEAELTLHSELALCQAQ